MRQRDLETPNFISIRRATDMGLLRGDRRRLLAEVRTDGRVMGGIEVFTTGRRVQVPYHRLCIALGRDPEATWAKHLEQIARKEAEKAAEAR